MRLRPSWVSRLRHHRAHAVRSGVIYQYTLGAAASRQLAPTLDHRVSPAEYL